MSTATVEMVNPDTGEVVRASLDDMKRQLALFEGYVMEAATLHLTAGIDIPMDVSALIRLGEKATVEVSIGGEKISFDARVTKRGFALEKGQDGDRIPVTRHVLVADPDTVSTSVA